MIQSGILRAFGPDLWRLLVEGTFGNRLAAFAAGFGLTTSFKSVTATGLMTASFAGPRYLDESTLLKQAGRKGTAT